MFFNIDNSGQCLKNFFQFNYTTIIVTLVKIIRKNANSVINYAEKSFTTLASLAYVIIFLCQYVTISVPQVKIIKKYENKLTNHFNKLGIFRVLENCYNKENVCMYVCMYVCMQVGRYVGVQVGMLVSLIFPKCTSLLIWL